MTCKQHVHSPCPPAPFTLQVDCTVEVDLCRSHFIQGFPSLRVFRKGHDDITVGGVHGHEAYMGDRTLEALTAFADVLVPSAGKVCFSTWSGVSSWCLQGLAQVRRHVPRTRGTHSWPPCALRLAAGLGAGQHVLGGSSIQTGCKFLVAAMRVMAAHHGSALAL